VKSSEHDHGYHARQKKNYNKRVENAKPLYVCVWHWLQDVVPSRWPFDGVIHLKPNKAPPDPPVLQLYYSIVQIAAKSWQFLNNSNSNRNKFSYLMQLHFKAFYTQSSFLNNLSLRWLISLCVRCFTLEHRIWNWWRQEHVLASW
jgi:hypothetical protein